jgi:hypothetical protein
MVETLEHLIQHAADHPRHSRMSLYKELLHSETFLLNLGAPIADAQTQRMSWSNDSFDIWADKDPEMGGIWIPVFVARDTITQYVSDRRLKAPAGKEFLWMENAPGQVFALLKGVDCFAGLTLFLDSKRAIPLPWTDVKALSEGRIPGAEPHLYESPLGRLVLPFSAKIALGTIKVGGVANRMLCLPAAGHFSGEDMRKLVRLTVENVGQVYTTCRHYIQILRHTKANQSGGLEEILECLFRFEMYGEAEALCSALVHRGKESLAWPYLAAIYLKCGKLSECAELCQKAGRKFPDERAFLLHGVRALAALGRGPEALKWLKEAESRFAGDSLLMQLSEKLQ